MGGFYAIDVGESLINAIGLVGVSYICSLKDTLWGVGHILRI